MSRVGRKPVVIPEGVKVSIKDNLVSVEGPKGKLAYQVATEFKLELKDNLLAVSRPSDSKIDMSKHGLIKSLLQNMVKGVKAGYVKELEVRGVGFKTSVQGKTLSITLGYTHPIEYPIPDGISIEATKQNIIVITGPDKAQVGEVAAEIRAYYKPEPYKGKGIRYVGEYVRHKAGKTVA